MRGTVSKRLRRQAKKLSKGKVWKKTYKHLKAIYKKHGAVDVIGDAERKAKLERTDDKRS